MLSRFDRLVLAHVERSPWTNAYGAARTILALGTALTLIFSNTETLFRPGAGIPETPLCLGIMRFSAYCLAPRAYVGLTQAVLVVALLVIATGWRPRWTCLPHWWISASFAVAPTIPDGGDQVTQLLTLLLVPVALTDARRWHWSAPQPTAGREIGSLVAWSSLFVVRMQVAGIYLQSSLGKLAVTEWVDGTAMYYWFTDPAFGLPAWSRGLLLPVVALPVGVALLTWGTIAFEFTLALGLVLSVRARGVLLPLGIAFHLLIGLLMGLGSFALAMIAALVLYLHPAERPLALPFHRLSWNVPQTVRSRFAPRVRPA